ncbi:MAG: DUF3467 domain-containing protein [Sandaracinaceae bacterium]
MTEQDPPTPSTASPQEIVIEIDWSDEPTPAYANGAQILNSQREFAVVFTDFVGFPGRGNAPVNQAPRAKIVSNVRLTPDVFFQLAAACASNWNKYVNRFGDPRVRTPKFKVVGGGEFQLEGIESPEPPA